MSPEINPEAYDCRLYRLLLTSKYPTDPTVQRLRSNFQMNNPMAVFLANGHASYGKITFHLLLIPEQ